MKLRWVRLYQFRNHAELRLEFGADRLLALGPNGRGKTNLLEAIYFLAAGRSFRAHRAAELTQFGCDCLSVSAEIEGEEGARTALAIELTHDHKRPLIDGQPAASWSDYLQRLPALAFTPWDGWIIKGGAAERRPFLDRAVFLVEPDHLLRVTRFQRALAQRNALLRRLQSGAGGLDELNAWDEEYIDSATAVVEGRQRFVAAMTPRWMEAHSRLAGQPVAMGMSYESEWASQPETPPARDSLLARLRARRQRDIDTGLCGWGPHRDDLLLTREAQPLRRYGSQGQIRLALLAFRLAQIAMIHEATGKWPLLLLDDVFGELDPERRHNLMALLGNSPIFTLATAAQPDIEAEGWARLML